MQNIKGPRGQVQVASGLRGRIPGPGDLYPSESLKVNKELQPRDAFVPVGNRREGKIPPESSECFFKGPQVGRQGEGGR